MSIGMFRSFAVTGVALRLFTCSNDPKTLGVRSDNRFVAMPCQTGACPDTVSVTFLGVGGFVIRYGAHAVMTAPFFTRPSFARVIAPGGSDDSVVGRALNRFDTSGVEAILAGHSHYDHLMDIPPIMHRMNPMPQIFGSATMGYVLAADPAIDRAKVHAIDTSEAASVTATGQWYYLPDPISATRWFRIKAVMSTHAPNFGDVTISDYTLHEDQTTLPPTPFKWPKGEVFAYIIDVLKKDSVLFRIYYQDSASDPEHSLRPKLEAGDAAKFNLVILCGGNFDKAGLYPITVLDAFKPSYAIIGHWDDFFRDVDDRKLVPGLKGERLRKRMNQSMEGRWAALRPFSTALFPVTPLHQPAP